LRGGSERLLLIVHTRNFGPFDVHSVGGPFFRVSAATTGTSKETMLGAGYWLPRSPMKPGRGNSGSVGGGMAVHEKRAPTRLSGLRWGHSFVAAARQRLCKGACEGVEFFCGFPEDSIEMPLQGSQCCEACGDGVGGVAQIPVCPLGRHPEARCSRKKSPDATVGAKCANGSRVFREKSPMRRPSVLSHEHAIDVTAFTVC
jgi:hypothetical protein